MAKKKLMNQKDRLKLWRSVRRMVKAHIVDGNSNGLCCLIDRVVNHREDLRPYSNKLMARYPELRRRRPKRVNRSYWWSLTPEGMKKRLEVCNEIIKELEYKK